MRRTAVIFMLIFTLLLACVCSGCGAGNSSDGQSGSDSSPAAGDSKKTGDSAPDTSGKTGDASSIPDTNESAVTDWGTADADTAAGAQDPARSSGSSDTAFSQVIINSEDLYFAIKNVKKDAALGYTWKVYVENRTDRNLMFSFEKTSVNGVMCDPFWADIVAAGKRSYTTVLWDKSALEENEITEVEEISFPMIIYADDDIGSPIVEETFELTP